MKKIRASKGKRVVVSPFDQVNHKDEVDNSEKQIEQMNYPSSIITYDGKHRIHCLTIAGEIEGHNYLEDDVKTTKYECVIPQLIAIEQDPTIDGLLVILNTIGGDIEAGLAVSEIIAGMKTPTVSMVIGGGHSIGVPLAVAAKKSFIAKSASMMIHSVRMNGTNLNTPQTFHYFQRIQDRITEFVVENSNISQARFKKLVSNTEELSMDVGSVLNGPEAVKEGLINYLGTISDAIDYLCKIIDKGKKSLKSKKKK